MIAAIQCYVMLILLFADTKNMQDHAYKKSFPRFSGPAAPFTITMTNGSPKDKAKQ